MPSIRSRPFITGSAAGQEQPIISLRSPAVCRRLRVAVGALGATIVLLVFASSASATFPGKNGLITFSADTGNGFRLYTVRPNGHDLQRITDVVGDAVNPDWSPDGRQIVFELDHPTGEPFCSIELINADGSGLSDLAGNTNGCEAQPSFTPDGQRIVFERFDDITNVDAIWSMDLDGADRHLITTGTANGVTDPNVSPDGERLSFIEFNGLDFGQALYTSGIDGSSPLQLTAFSFDVAIKQDWAPDGQHIVFTNNADFPNPGDSANIATIAPDGTGLHFLTQYTGGQVNAFVGSYSPNGRWIVFRLEDHGQYGLYRMHPDGSSLHPILRLSSFKPRFIDWGPRTSRANHQH
jgi:Tol biopolymer transport system component